MNRRDFLKAFSATTTLATATSLANIVEAKPVIETLEPKIILPGDKDFDVDHVFTSINYFSHLYDGYNQMNFGFVVNEYVGCGEDDIFRFTFNLETDYASKFDNFRLPKGIEDFLQNNIFEAFSKNVQYGDDDGYGNTGLEILRACVSYS